MAEDTANEEQQEPNPQNDTGGEQQNTAAEAEALRAEVAQVKATLQQLQQAQGDDQSEQFKAYVANLLDGAAKDPSQWQRAKAEVEEIAKNYAISLSNHTKDKQLAMQWRANWLAEKLVHEHGGNFNTLKNELLKSADPREMDIAAREIALRLGNDPKAQQRKSGGSVDEGRGSAGRQNIYSEMAEIDPTTPEGLKAWREKEATFERMLTGQR